MRMRNIGIMAAYEYRTNFRRGGFLFATFGLPLLAALVLLGIRWLSQRPETEGLIMVDLNKPMLVLDRAGLLPPTLPEGFTWAEDEAAGKDAVRSGDALALVILPPGYPEQVHRLQVFLTPGAEFSEALNRRLTVLVAYAHWHEVLSPDELALLQEPPEAEIVVLAGQAERQQQTQNTMRAYILSVVYFMALFSTAGYLLQSVALEKESRMVEVLLSTVTTWEMLWGKMAGLSALGFTQLAVWVVSARWLLGSAAGPAMGSFGSMSGLLSGMDWTFAVVAGAALLLGYLLYALLMVGLGALGNNVRESQQFSMFVSLTGTLPLMLGSLFFLNPNGLVPRVLSFIPWTAPLSIMLRVALTAVPTGDIIAAFASMLLGVGIAAWVGIRLFRVGILMSGKKPSWREVWYILRRPV